MDEESETQSNFGYLNMDCNKYRRLDDSSENEDQDDKAKERKKNSDFSKPLSYHKKLAFELDTLSKKQKRKFTRSLAKYQFQMEVYVPHSMVISKKEYYGKNYLLNRLVNFENIIQDKKKFMAPISVENKKFGRQYKFVKKENAPHQKDYLDKIEKVYEKKGYESNNIAFKKNENIFSPSLLLDNNFGKYPEDDIVRYRTTENQKEYKKDRRLLNKFQNILRNRGGGNNYDKRIIRNKSPKNSSSSLFSSNDSNKLNHNYFDNVEIKNMTGQQYFKYSKGLKKEIKKIIKNIKSLDDKEKDDDFYDKKNLVKEKNIKLDSRKDSINKNRDENIDKNSDKNIIIDNKINENDKNEKMVNFNSNVFLSSKGMKKNEIINNTRNRVNKYSDSNFPKINVKNAGGTIGEVSRNNSKKYKLSSFNISKKNIPKKKIEKKSIKEEKLNELYNNLYYFTDADNFPYKKINNYFKTYTTIKVPNVDFNSGSNIHGLMERTQHIVKEKSFSNFAKLNNEYKMDFYPFNERKMIDVDLVEDLDKRISNLHYEYTNNLLGSQKEEVQL